MTDETTDDGISRRKIVVGILSVAGGALALTHFGTRPVLAASFTISDDSVTTDNGVLQGLTLTVDTTTTWDGAENEPGDTTIELQVDHDGTWETVASNTENLTGLAGTYEYQFSSADVIGNTSWKKSDFNATGDGSVNETTIDARLSVSTTGDVDGDGSGDTFTSSTDSFTITVENEANSNSAGGSGSSNAQGTNNEP